MLVDTEIDLAISEVKRIYLSNMHKSYSELSIEERALLADIVCDKQYFNRTSCLLGTDRSEVHEFLSWVRKQYGHPYAELPDGKRWEAEDKYFRE